MAHEELHPPENLESPAQLDVESLSLGMIASAEDPDHPKLAFLFKDLKYRLKPEGPFTDVGSGLLFISKDEFKSLLSQMIEAARRAGILNTKRIITPGEG